MIEYEKLTSIANKMYKDEEIKKPIFYVGELGNFKELLLNSSWSQLHISFIPGKSPEITDDYLEKKPEVILIENFDNIVDDEIKKLNVEKIKKIEKDTVIIIGGDSYSILDIHSNFIIVNENTIH